jgi:hypothetical protein
LQPLNDDRHILNVAKGKKLIGVFHDVPDVGAASALAEHFMLVVRQETVASDNFFIRFSCK